MENKQFGDANYMYSGEAPPPYSKTENVPPSSPYAPSAPTYGGGGAQPGQFMPLQFSAVPPQYASPPQYPQQYQNVVNCRPQGATPYNYQMPDHGQPHMPSYQHPAYAAPLAPRPHYQAAGASYAAYGGYMGAPTMPSPAAAYPYQQVVYGSPVGQQAAQPQQIVVNVGAGRAAPRATVMATGLFEAGAMFDGISRPNVPPPPPGCAPNVAQVAVIHGHQVVGTQKSGGFFSGTGSGGYTFGI